MTKARLIKIITIVLMLSLVIFANFITVRMMMAGGVEINFYDKLLTAYQAGGMTALKNELARITENNKGPGVLSLAQGFEGNLAAMGDPGPFLENITTEKRSRFILLRNLRAWMIGLLVLIMLTRLAVNLFARKKHI